jgi:hypothetical protein
VSDRHGQVVQAAGQARLAAIWEARGVLRRSEVDHAQAARCSRRPPNSSPTRDDPSTRPAAEPRPQPPPDLDVHPDRPMGQVPRSDGVGPLGLSAEREHLRLSSYVSALLTLGPPHPPIPSTSEDDHPAKALLNAGVVGAGGVEPPSSSVSAKSREPLCGSPFPQVALDRKGRSYQGETWMLD